MIVPISTFWCCSRESRQSGCAQAVISLWRSCRPPETHLHPVVSAREAARLGPACRRLKSWSSLVRLSVSAECSDSTVKRIWDGKAFQVPERMHSCLADPVTRFFAMIECSLDFLRVWLLLRFGRALRLLFVDVTVERRWHRRL